MIPGIVAATRALITGDPFYENVSSLLHFNGADGSTTIVDQKTRVWSVAGAAAIDAAQSVFGGASLAVVGPNDYLTTGLPGHTDFAYGTGDFTIEFWMRAAAINMGTANVIYDQRQPPAGPRPRPTIYLNSNLITYYASGADRIVGSALNVGQWYHIAVARHSGITRLFVDGALVGSFADAINYELSPVAIGADGNQAQPSPFNFQGWVDELRITKGVARYTAAFTVPTKQFPDHGIAG